MIALSLNEVETLAAKLGRGAGLAWGLAEELSRGARRLAEAGLPWAQALIGFAEGASSWRAPDPANVPGWREGRRASTGEGALCPLRLATLLMDDPSILRAGALRVEKVALPLWLAGSLVPLKGESGFHIGWPNAALEVYGWGIALVAGEGDWQAGQASVTITPLPRDRPSTPRHNRAATDASTLAALSAVAEGVYVPASEASRARGAGGGSVDED